MRRLSLFTVILAFALVTPLTSTAADKEDARAQNASRVLREILMIPEESIPQSLLRNAEAIAVLPDVVKAGLVIGGRRGRGLLTLRTSDGSWSNPTFITMTGGSVGFQAGVQSADVILVFRTRRGVDNIVNGKFTLGADASVAAGPVGRSAQASTDGQLKAEIYSYSRARGLFAGVSIDGAVLSIDHRANNRVYDGDTTPRMILENRSASPSAPIIEFRDQIEEAIAQAGSR